MPEIVARKSELSQPNRLHKCNPELSGLITEAIGDGWVGDLEQIAELRDLVDDTPFLDEFAAAKRRNKENLARIIKESYGITVNPDAMFDIQIKRIHEYKRQLLNALQIVARYQAILANPDADWLPLVKVFSGKAAPSYTTAKLIIKLINDIAHVVNNDPVVGDRLKVVYVPNYNVTRAEEIIPGADLSEQISTAGMDGYSTPDEGAPTTRGVAAGAGPGDVVPGARPDVARLRELPRRPQLAHDHHLPGPVAGGPDDLRRRLAVHADRDIGVGDGRAVGQSDRRRRYAGGDRSV